MPLHWPALIGCWKWDGWANSPTSGQLIGGNIGAYKEFFEHVDLHNRVHIRCRHRQIEEKARKTDGKAVVRPQRWQEEALSWFNAARTLGKQCVSMFVSPLLNCSSILRGTRCCCSLLDLTVHVSQDISDWKMKIHFFQACVWACLWSLKQLDILTKI